MCLLMVIQPGTTLTDVEIMDFTKSNQDGYGFMRSTPDDVLVEKSHTMKGFLKKFKEWQRWTDKSGQPFVCHTRMKTHGGIDHANTHPYAIGTTGAYMAHNGILRVDTKSNPSMSDTYHYIASYVEPLLRKDPSVIENEAIKFYIGEHIGGSNKFVILVPGGKPVIINELDGIEFKGSWFSNTYAWSAHGRHHYTQHSFSRSKGWDPEDWESFHGPGTGHQSYSPDWKGYGMGGKPQKTTTGIPINYKTQKPPTVTTILNKSGGKRKVEIAAPLPANVKFSGKADWSDPDSDTTTYYIEEALFTARDFAEVDQRKRWSKSRWLQRFAKFATYEKADDYLDKLFDDREYYLELNEELTEAVEERTMTPSQLAALVSEVEAYAEHQQAEEVAEARAAVNIPEVTRAYLMQ